MWFLFGEVSSSSGCLGWATLFYCGTPLAFHMIILQIVKIQREHMVNTHKVKRHRNTDTKKQATENHNKTTALERSVMNY